MKKIMALMLILLASSNINANPSYEESLLINEYQKLLVEGNEFNDLRLNEIEYLAVSSKDYYFLRDSIAGSYLFSHKNRKFHSRNDIYKKFLEPNINNPTANAIPISVLLVSAYEPEYESDLLDVLYKKILNGDEITKVHLASYFWMKKKYDEALNVLPVAYKNIIGINFKSNNDLSVASISEESSATFLKQGDKVIALNSKPVGTISQLSNELSLFASESTQLLSYERDGKILEDEFLVTSSLNINIAPYRALILFDQGNIETAQSLANDFEGYKSKLSDDFKSSPFFKKLNATNNFVLCRIYAQPANTDIEQRLEGVELCKQSLTEYEFGILNEQMNAVTFEYTLNRFNLFWGIGYANTISILTSTYLKSFYNSGLGLEQESDNFELAKEYLEKSPFLFSNEEVLKTAILDIFKNGELDKELQYNQISSNTLFNLKALGKTDGYPSYSARYHLIQMYKYDEKYKDLDEAFKYAKLSYEKDKEYYNSAFGYISMLYYGQGTDKNRKKAHELMIEYTESMLEEKSFSEAQNEDKWILSALARDYGQGVVTEIDYEKIFYYYKDIYGYSNSMDKALFFLAIDDAIDISQPFLNLLLEDDSLYPTINESNLNSYVAYKAFGGLAPFSQKDIEAACRFSRYDINLTNNPISKYIYSYCVLTEEVEGNDEHINFIKNLSDNGSSEASWFLYHIEKDKSGTEIDYKQLKTYLTLANNQLSSNTSKNLIKDIDWLNDAAIFDINKQSLKEDLDYINSKIREEEAYARALQKTKDQKEKNRLAEIKAANRQEAMKKTGSFLADVLEFTVKAVLVVGVAAVAGDALEDSSPEFKQAFADSLSGSMSSSGTSYSNKYDTYQCKSARNELTSARKRLGLSNNLMGNMSCSNAGGSCMTPLPKQCYNRAASCRAGDYSCTSRENANYHNCQSQARVTAQNAKNRCEARKRQLINQCNNRVNNNNKNRANVEIRNAQNKVNQYCY